jgi:hypothetical protein
MSLIICLDAIHKCTYRYVFQYTHFLIPGSFIRALVVYIYHNIYPNYGECHNNISVA